MPGFLLRLLGPGCASGLVASTFVLLSGVTIAGCADGGGTSVSGFTSVPNPTQVSSATNEGMSSTSAGDTGPGPTTGEAGEAGTTGAPPAPSTSGGDVSTTTAVDPSTTTTVDPSTTAVDPSTMTSDDTTGVMTTLTTDGTTTNDPPPPPKDPQPATGLYENCVDSNTCDLALTDGCFTIIDDNMKVLDGYCTILCNVAGDCGPKPNVPAVQECFAISADQKICGLKCTGVKDCPTGMACTNLALPNNKSGMYCT